VRRVLSITVLLAACGPSPDAAPVDDGACAERLDPLRDDDRTPFGLRPNQVRVALGGDRTGQLDAVPVTVDLAFTGGLAVQVWADPTEEPAPEPPPPLWCTDRTELSGTLALLGEDARLDAFREPIVGRVHAHGPLDALQSAFTADLAGTAAPGILGERDPERTRIYLWAWLDDDRVEVRAGADDSATDLLFEVALDPVSAD